MRTVIGRQEAVGAPVGAWPVAGSSEVKVTVNMPFWTLKISATSTFKDEPSVFW